MSKMDNLRAMREAKYAAAQRAGGSATPAARSIPSKPKPASKATASKKAPSETPSAQADELCGHRNMSGRTCTRDKGHAAKSHRYS